jgi:replicative DNA helicase
MGATITMEKRPRRDTAPALADRLPPNSEQAEQSVLGCIMLDPATLSEAIEVLASCGSEAFFTLAHKTVYELFIEMFDARQPITTLTVAQRLRDRQQLEAIGGMAFLSSLPDTAGTSTNIGFHLKVILEKWYRRQLILTCTEAVSNAYDVDGDAVPIIAETEARLLKTLSVTPTKQVIIKEAVRAVLSTIEHSHERQGGVDGIPTGFVDLDKMTGGLHPENGEMWVLAARPSMGKTSLAMNIAEHVAINCKVPVGVFSMEMSAHSLVLRMLCSRARVNSQNIRDGYLTQTDFARIGTTAPLIAHAPIYIDDTPAQPLLQLRSRARRWVQLHGIKVIFVDYMQKARGSGRRFDSRQSEVADISNGLSALFKELKVAGVVLSQLNRELDKERNRRPRLSDLRESGEIEQDADFIGFLHRPKAKEEEDPHADALPVDLCVEKQRNGRTGDIHLTFLKTITRFESAARMAPGD